MTRGYDHFPPNQQLLLDLPLREGTGIYTASWAKPPRQFTLTGTPVWTPLANDLTILDFDSTTPDYIEATAGASGDMNFTAGDFSGLAWILTTAVGNRYVFNKGTGTTGWAFYLNGQAEMDFYTAQAGPAVQSTEGDVLALNIWHCVGFSRAGAVVRIYTNGVDVTTTSATHVNPDSAAATAFTIGSTAAGGSGWWDGRIWRPRVWDKVVTSALFRAIFENERYLFGV